MFFFFQAEDGIRDKLVTGVQTCALPISYPGALYGFLGFNLSTGGDTTKPHALFGDRPPRRALTMAVDREGLRKSVWEDLAHAPPGPLARLWWSWDPYTPGPPYDAAPARRRSPWLC